MPRISVITAAYNSERFLDATIGSVLQQTFSDWELIIANDASRDRTLEIAQKAAEENKRITVIDNRCNLGPGGARNLALKKCDSEFVAICDADDLCHPRRLEKQLEFMNSNARIFCLGSGVNLVSDDLEPRGQWIPPETSEELSRSILRICPIVHSAAFMRREMLNSLGGYDESLKRSQDYDLWVRAHRKFPLHNLQEILVTHRIRPFSSWTSIVNGARITAKAGFQDHRPVEGLYFATRYFMAGALRRSGLVNSWSGQ